MTSIDDLNKKKRSVQSQITKLQGVINGHQATPITPILAKLQLKAAEKQSDESNEILAAIALLCTDAEFSVHAKVFGDMDTKLLHIQAFLIEIIEADVAVQQQQQQQQHQQHVVPPPPIVNPGPGDVKLPRIDIPKFSGNLCDWMSFQDIFTATIHNNARISDVQKLTYLKSYLVGSAAKVLASMACTDANYNVAWTTLQNRYQNKRELVFSVLKRFMNQNAMAGESATALRSIIDVSLECLRSLEGLGLTITEWDCMIIFVMLQKLDSQTRQFWELSLANTELPKLKEFTEFLEQRARALAAGASCKATTDTKHGVGGQGKKERIMAHHGKTDPACRVCTESHTVFRCPTFIAMDFGARHETVKRLGLCFNCLVYGHKIGQCTNKLTCKMCKAKHNTLLHSPRRENEQPAGDANAGAGATAHIFHSSSKGESGQGMLATAIVKLFSQSNHPQLHRAFLDSGSTASFITEASVRRLGLHRVNSAATVTGLGSTRIGSTRGKVIVEIHPYFHTRGDETFQVELMILPSITCDLPSHQCNPEDWPYLRPLQLADPSFHKPGKVDILLGADIFWDILSEGKKSGGPGTPTAKNSKLGWLVAGQTQLKSPNIQVHHAEVNLDQSLQRFWELESVPVGRIWTKEEKEAEEHFVSTVNRNSDGVYSVSLPFKTDPPKIGASRDIALRRLMSLERRLKANLKLKQEYVAFMTEYQTLGHMERIENPALFKSSVVPYYIPHHFVKKESSTTTKFRVVFDASSKTSSGLSLNDNLKVGPTIQDSLIFILMRFRTHVVALTADITKMYRQIHVKSPHTDYQRILWRDDPRKEVQEYRLRTVTYGTASGSFHATRVLKQLALDERESTPIASDVMSRDFYMDDLMSGAPTTAAAVEAHQQLVELARRGGFQLRKWWSNDPQVMSAIPQKLRETQVPLNLDKDDLVKTLGVHWNPGEDTFSFKVNLPVTNPLTTTKRNFLSEMSKIFDPLGWLAPIIIRGKILFQLVWKAGTDWDEALPDDILESWLTFRVHLVAIEAISIPRCLKPEMTIQISLHGFCDASEKAYAAVVYTKANQHHGDPVISIVTAKTRVAPSNPISLPRLELCGALLLAKTMSSVQESLVMNFTEVKAWSDSTVVLAWIRGNPALWKTFVANRVTEIQEIIPANAWGHVRGVDNPADCASRGIDPEDLKDHPLWWRGPDWLMQDTPDPQTTGTEIGPICLAMVEQERKQTIITATIRVIPYPFPLTDESSLPKLERVTAWMFRFLFNCRSVGAAKRSGPLSVTELDHGLMLWVKSVQEAEFGREMRALVDKKGLPSSSKIANLNPFMDKVGILRVGGRLQNAPIPEKQKHPILIPRHHHMTELIIDDAHKMTLHGGAQLVHQIIQRRFWILGAKDAIRHRLKQCVTCCRHRGSTMEQFMGNLPMSRVTPARPFLTCGVDYAGPFLVRAIPSRSKVTFKAYLALFICFVSHAVHLEVVSSLSTDAFMATLRRFIARRGKPRDIHSDCGTNFVGASRELKLMASLVHSQGHNQQVADALSLDGIQWHFNPPGSPHFGGLWEAGVKSVKHHLHRVIGTARLNFEELTTTMTQIEACLNSRPMTPVSTCPDNLEALTPGHFLIGDSLLAIPELDLTQEKENRLTRWQRVQKLTQHFWKRWSGEFLSRLQQRPKWLQHRTECRVGDLVLIKEDNLPPLKWRLGRITATHPGADGHVRVATVKTAEGEVKRSIVKLCLLPNSDKSSDETKTAAM